MSAQLGLDLGSFSIKAVELENKGKSRKLLTLGEIRTPVNLHSQSETDKRAIANTIRRLIGEAKISTNKAVFGLTENDVFTQVVEFPYLSDTELAAAIDFEAEQYIPVPLSEVKLEYLVISSRPTGKDKRMQVLLVAARKAAIDHFVSLIELAGLQPVALETQVLASVRLVNSLFEKGNFLLLELGHTTSNIIVLQDQKISLTRTLKTGGEALTRAVASELGMELIQAEQYKSSYGLEANVLEGKVAKAMLPAFNIVIEELKKAHNFSLQKDPNLKINSLIVSGAAALMPGLNSYLAQTINLEVVTLDPFQNFTADKRIEQLKFKSRFTTAVGLALRQE